MLQDDLSQHEARAEAYKHSREALQGLYDRVTTECFVKKVVTDADMAREYETLYADALDLAADNPTYPPLPPRATDGRAGLDDLRRWCIQALKVKGGQKPQEPPRAVSPLKAPSLQPDDLTILEVLCAEAATILVADLAERLKRSGKTVGQRLARLKTLGLVEWPLGPRKGVAITEKGRGRLA